MTLTIGRLPSKEGVAVPLRSRDLPGNRAERSVEAVLVLKTELENLNRYDLAFEFSTQDVSGFRKPLVTTRFAPTFQCGLQELLGSAYQVPRCLDAQVGILGQGQCLLPDMFGKFPIGKRLQTPSHAPKQELFVIRAGRLPKQFEIFGAQLADRCHSQFFNFQKHDGCCGSCLWTLATQCFMSRSHIECVNTPVP